MPIVFARMDARSLRLLAKDNPVTFVDLADGVPATRYSATDYASGSHESTFYNANGSYADRENIGMLEDAQCRLYEEHDSFNGSGHPTAFQYMDSIHTCTTDSQCGVCNGEGGTNGVCRSGTCVLIHGSQVGGMISSSRSGTAYGAAGATLWLANKGQYKFGGPVYPVVECYPPAEEDAYSWFTDNAVHLTNESFGCIDYGGPTTISGVTQDYFARYSDIAIFKSAGNLNGHDGSEVACMETMNTICVGSVDDTNTLDTTSAWTNAGDSNVPIDRERPNIVAQGKSSQGLSLSGTSATGLVQGTSFAAPLATGLAALLQESCGDNLNHLRIRSIFINAAWSLNVHGSVYSTPTPLASDPTYGSYHKDWKDGGGYPFADALDAFCHDQEGGPQNKAVELQVNPTTDGDSPPEGSVPIPQSKMPDFRTQKWGNIGGPASQSLDLDSHYLAAGERLRATISWDTCLAPSHTQGPGDPAASYPDDRTVNDKDYDIVLYNSTTSSYATGSMSVSDNNEGFDFTATTAGNYEIKLIWQSGTTGCTSSLESFGFSETWGTY